MTLTGDGLAYRLLDGGQAAAHAEDFGELHAEVYADPPYRLAGDEDYPRRFAVQRRQPGFVLAEARGRSPMMPLTLFRSRTFTLRP